MNKGIVITTSEYTKDFLLDCLESIDTKYPILLVSQGGYQPNAPGVETIINPMNGWEPASIAIGKYKFDEFIHIMDTTFIKDNSLFDELFAIEGNVVLTKGNFHYMGKFVSKLLPDIPVVKNKDEAILIEQTWLGNKYTEFEPDLPVHTNIFETINGQYRMRLENDYLIKWKGTWKI